MSTKTTALQVCVRLRPLNDKECKAGGEAWSTLSEYQTVCEVGSDGKPIKDSGATFDKVYGGDSTTEEVYAAIGSPLVDNAMNGLNGTIFAYGQTSSGKTFTMQGDNKKRNAKAGFIEMAARQIFDYIQSKPEREFLLRLSYIEIYNEVIRDLLQPNKKLGTNLKIHVNPRSGPYVQSITEVVTDASSIMQALRRGDTMRAVDATDMNERSSRSHTIFKIMLESKERSERRLSGDDDVDGAILESHLNFVDLAGSENVRHTGAEGNRLKEAGRINTSLLTLSRVIKQISSGAGHINFRDSKLTHILQPSLAGNCKTALIACATPSVCFREETRTTLAFAQRAKLIKTCAKVNETLDEDCQLRRMKKDLRDARKKQKKMEEELSKMQSGKTQEELSALRDALAVTQNISLEAKTAKETADKKYENLKNLVLSSVINAGVSRKRDVNAMKARRRRRHSMLPSMLLGMRGSEFARLDEDDEEKNTVGGALGLISSVAVASPSLKKGKTTKRSRC
jgi:centromeric protein E